jgi:general stress protein 26
MSEGDTGKLWDLIKSVEYAMLATEDGDHIRSRPMATVQKEFDGNLWFFTRASAHKVTEVDQDHRVNVSYAHPGKQNYVSVSGRAKLVQDAATVKDHWVESMRTWFPKGTDDPDIALLKVEVEQAEYWDAPSSTMVHAYGYVKAALTGQPPHPGGNAKLNLG